MFLLLFTAKNGQWPVVVTEKLLKLVVDVIKEQARPATKYVSCGLTCYLRVVEKLLVVLVVAVVGAVVVVVSVGVVVVTSINSGHF